MTTTEAHYPAGEHPKYVYVYEPITLVLRYCAVGEVHGLGRSIDGHVAQFQLGSPPPPGFHPQPSCTYLYASPSRYAHATLDFQGEASTSTTHTRSTRTRESLHHLSRLHFLTERICRGFYNSIMSRAPSFGSMGLGRDDAHYWHRRIYSGLVCIRLPPRLTPHPSHTAKAN